jgi:cytosine/adenosine deaminase-related metal-dependent hydrolase
MKRINKHYPKTPTATLLKWGTQNGAKLLGIDNAYGSLAKDKSPGINLISSLKAGEITDSSEVVKLG